MIRIRLNELKMPKAERTMTSPWQYVPLNQYERPPEPVSEKAKSSLGRLWVRMFHKKTIGKRGDFEAELSSVPDQLLDMIAPVPDLSQPTEALESALQKIDFEQKESIQVIIGPPGSGTGSILKNYAERRKWRLIRPPSSEQILRGDESWVDELVKSQPSLLVLPELEKCYLRHYNGLILIRRLLGLLWRQNVHCLLGCQSWAWAYLNKAIGIGSTLPPPLIVQAFDGLRLQHWLEPISK